jgi:2-desacetyl-2-hydroxyethyl bacteriochlorophyllide A dehydrogenase
MVIVMMFRMENVIITAESRNKVILRKVKVPEISKNEALVKGIVSGISHATELAVITGATPTFHKGWNDELRCFDSIKPSKKYPANLGYEYVGEVIKVGSDITHLKKGDIVWMDAPHRTYNILNGKTPFIKLNSKQDIRKAAFLALTRVALAGVHDAKPKMGDIVLVSGLGTIGLIVVQLLKLAGARTIIAVDPLESRRKMAASFGAITIDPTEADAGVAAKKLTQCGVDIAIECSGSSVALNSAIKACAVGGTVVTVATYREGATHLFLGEEWHRNRITLLSSMSVNGCPHRDYPLWDLDRLNNTAWYLLSEDKVLVDSFISQEFNVEEAYKAYELINRQPNETLKVVLTY